MPSTQELPPDLVIEVLRSRKTRVAYTSESCVTNSGIVVIDEPTRRTGLAKRDLVLHRKIEELSRGVPPGACAAVTLRVSRFECETDKAQGALRFASSRRG